MAAGKEIRGKIKSVENTKKITKAMEMVAASKMRKAQDRMRAARPYSEKIRNIAANLGKANPEYVHPFMQVNDAKAAGVIVVTTDKGLCGGMNTNVLRAVTTKLRELQSGRRVGKSCGHWQQGLGLPEPCGCQGGFACDGSGRHAPSGQADWPGEGAARRYAEGKINAVYLSYTKFINTMKQESVVEQLLPLSSEQMQAERRNMAGTTSMSRTRKA
jgi:F-type H+-transporting ATPase subunit gamma